VLDEVGDLPQRVVGSHEAERLLESGRADQKREASQGPRPGYAGTGSPRRSQARRARSCAPAHNTRTR
jgi:hypothetical protein